jgi:hypothetical protein
MLLLSSLFSRKIIAHASSHQLSLLSLDMLAFKTAFWAVSIRGQHACGVVDAPVVSVEMNFSKLISKGVEVLMRT